MHRMGGQSSGRRWARSCRFLKSAVYIIATSAGQHNPASTGPRPATNVLPRLLFVVSAVIRPARTITSFCAGPDRRSMPTALRRAIRSPVVRRAEPAGSPRILARRVGRSFGEGQGRWASVVPRIVPAGRDLQHPAHGGHAVFGLVRRHELESLDGSESVSRANQAAAFRRMSRSSRRVLTSRRRRRTSSRSSVVRPSARWPSSRSAYVSQLRIVWADGSNCRPSSSGERPERASSMSRARSCGGYGGRVFGIVDSFPPRGAVSTKPGQVHFCRIEVPREGPRGGACTVGIPGAPIVR